MAYTKQVTVALKQGVYSGDLEDIINAHLGGNNRFADGAVYQKESVSYNVLCFAARDDFTLSPIANSLVSISPITTTARQQLEALGLSEVT